jgi:hypothetical protein
VKVETRQQRKDAQKAARKKAAQDRDQTSRVEGERTRAPRRSKKGRK